MMETRGTDHPPEPPASPPDASVPDWSRDAIARIVPAPCTFEVDRSEDILVLFPEGVFHARKKRATPLPSRARLGFDSIAIDDRRARRSQRRIRWEEIDSFACSDRQEFGAVPNRYRRFGRELRIRPKQGPEIRVMLPYDEATRILEVARVHLGDRVREGGEAYAGRAPASFRVHELLFAMIPFVGLLMLCGIAVVLAVGWLLGWFRAVSGAGAGRARRRVAALAAASSAPIAIFFCAVAALFIPADHAWSHLDEWLLVGALVTGVLLGPVAFFLLRPALLAWPRRTLEAFPPRPGLRWAWFERLCNRWPEFLRKPWAGVLLQACGIAVLLGSWVLIGMIDMPDRLVRRMNEIGMAIACVPLYLGYRIRATSATRLRVRDQRAPVVFLRSFRDDGCGSFNLTDWRASFLGVQSIQSMDFLGPLANLNPIRLFRLVIGRAGDTAEEQLAGYFRRHGPFIAIGRPQEGLPTAGAARDYVDDSIWRTRVEEWMSQARLVVIQPGATGGIWWEIERALEIVPHERILFSLLAFDHRDSDYEAFALRLRGLLGIDVPLCRGDAMFLAIHEGRIVPMPMRHRNPFAWPRSGCTADLHAMIGPRLGQKVEPAPSSRWWPGGRMFDAAVLAAALVWSFTASIVPALVAVGGGLTLFVIQINHRSEAPFGSVARDIAWAGIAWTATDEFRIASEPGYCCEVESDVVGAVSIGGWYRQLDAGDRVELEAELEAELEKICEQRGFAKTAGSTPPRAIVAGGREWTELRRTRTITPRAKPGTRPSPLEPPPTPVEQQLVVRMAVEGDRLIAHWARRHTDEIIDIDAAFGALLDSARFVGLPADRDLLTLAPGDGWERAEAIEDERAAWSNASGDRVWLIVVPADFAVSPEDAKRSVEARLTRIFGATAPGMSLAGRSNQSASRRQMGEVLVRTEAGPDQPIVFERRLAYLGVEYRIGAQSSRGMAAAAELERALFTLRAP